MKLNLIALTGPQLSGKTTLARELEKRGWVFVDFTGRLKDIAALSLSLVGKPTTREDIEKDKAKYRRYLQELSALIEYNTDPSFVNRALWDAGYATTQDIRYVFDNVRTMEQWSVLKGYGFTLVRLRTPYNVRYLRAARQYHISHDEFESQHDHIIEQGEDLWGEAEIVLDGVKPFELLVKELIGEV